MWRLKYSSYKTSKCEKENHENEEINICSKGIMFYTMLDHPAQHMV